MTSYLYRHIILVYCPIGYLYDNNMMYMYSKLNYVYYTINYVL